MQKNCDLELRLFPTSPHSDSSDSSVIESSSSYENPQPKEESQRITIFYNGQMCLSSYVTHLQANSIISIANREMEDNKSSSNGSDPPKKLTRIHHSHNQLPNPKASMKRSLQSFLQKRKIRIQASSPYHHHHSQR